MICHRLACCIIFVSGVKYPDRNSIGLGVFLLTVLEYRILQKESGDNKSLGLLVILHPQSVHREMNDDVQHFFSTLFHPEPQLLEEDHS